MLSIKILSPENKTYNTTSVPFSFTVNGATSQIVYGLGGEEHITIAKNTTLIALTNGNYSLTIYVNDETLNIGFSKTIVFGVVNNELAPSPTESYPTMLIIASTGTVTIVGVGLLVYFMKRKR